MRSFSGILSVVLAGFIAGCGGDSDDHPANNIVQVAQSDSRFSILVEAVQSAGLVEALSAPGPITVFAPTNDAFGALLGELGVSKDQLLADKPLLTEVLQYHVLAGEVPSNKVPFGAAITPLNGGYFKIDQVNSNLLITDGRNRSSEIILTDIEASNGVIHAVNTVLLPADKTIVQTALANPDFSILVEAVTAAGLVETLSSPGPFTVFAPTNAAFAALLSELNVTKEQLLASTDLLTQVLTYHVVPGLVLKAEVPLNTPVTSVQGQSLSVGSNLSITDQRGRNTNIVATDILSSNGVIHVLDQVILPAP